MSCCNLNKTSFALQKEITDNSININYDVFQNGIIRSFTEINNQGLSGIWYPAYFTQNMSVESEQWNKVAGSGCKEGLGIQNFMSVANPTFIDWTTSNCDLSVDWVIKIGDCKEFDRVVLFWYRYYDIGRENDNRVFPGIDLYVSDGEFGIAGSTIYNSDNLSTLKNELYGQLLTAQYPSTEAMLKASILATSPQIDGLTEKLCGPGDYERDEFGRIKTFLQKMCAKRYSDIGTKNFPQNRYDLFKKLSQKFGQSLVFKPNTQGSLYSRFICDTGPNISVDMSGELFRKNIYDSCGYDTDFGFSNNLRLKTQHNIEIFSSSGVNNILLNDAIIGKTLTNSTGVFDPNFRNINFHGLGGVSFVSDLVSSGCNSNNKFTDSYFIQDYSATNTIGIEQTGQPVSFSFYPDSNSQYRLKSLEINYLRSDSHPECDSFIQTTKGRKSQKIFSVAGYTLAIRYSKSDGPCPGGHCCDRANYDIYIGDRYIGNANMNNSSDCGDRISVINLPNTYTNIDGSIDITFRCQYADCHGGVTWVQAFDSNGVEVYSGCVSTISTINIPLTELDLDGESGCNCYNVQRLSASPSGATNVDNSGQILYTPPTSMFNMPSGSFYGGLSNDVVLQNGIILPDHPVGVFPKTHKRFFPVGSSGCNLIVSGCESKILTYNIPYAAELVLNHEAAGASFKLSWNGEETSTNGLVNQSDSLVLSKPLSEPSLVTIEISTAVSSGTSDWGIELLANQRSYNQISSLVGSTLWGYKGFFHPNFGWTDDKTYYNLSPLTPKYNNASSNFFYNSQDMYNGSYLPGYNFLFSISGLAKNQKEQINSAEYIGIAIDQSTSYFVTDKWQKFNYNKDESLILENLILDYVGLDNYYGYIYNDFSFAIGSQTNKIILDSTNSVNRARCYLDDPVIKKDKIRLFSGINPDGFIDVNVTNIDVSSDDRTILTIDKNLSDEYRFGYVFRITDNDTSVIVYGKNSTINDPNILAGKWANLSYGDAEKFKLSSIDRRFNNSALRTSGSVNSNETWSSAFKVINNYDPNNITYYAPITRLLPNKQHQTLGYTNPSGSASSYQFAGDHIIASGNLDSSSAYLYVGPYIGNINIDIYLNSVPNSIYGYIQLYYNGSKIDSKQLSKSSDTKINFKVNKQVYTDPYVFVDINDESSNCFGLNIKNVDLKFARYIVSIDSSDSDLINRSRISYYEHKKQLQNKKTYALGFDGQNIRNISPLSEKITFNTQLAQNFSPYLDINIFSSSSSDIPFVSASGAIVFENLFKPKTQKYLDNMRYPYNKNLFWIDISAQKDWSILTSKGILLKSDQTYTFVKKVSYYCDENAKECASRYPKNLCSDANTVYEASLSQIFNLLGLSQYDSNFLDIKTVNYPNDCQTISYCCDNGDTACLQKEKQARDQCVADWSDVFETVSCEAKYCPVYPELEGKIYKSIEYYSIRIKKDIYPGNLQTKNENLFTFFNSNEFTNIPCINLNLPGLGRSFYYNYDCSYTSPKKCDYIIQPNLTGILSYVPGEFIDIAPYLYNQGNSISYPVPSSVIFENEKRYREFFSHTNIISDPLFIEYDKSGEINYDIVYDLNIKSSGCIGSGDLCSLTIDDWTCSFSITETNNGLYLSSTCFENIFLKSLADELNQYTDIITQYNYDKEHDCPPYINATGLFDCSKAAKYVQDNYGSDYKLAYCNKEFNSNKYTMLCQYCPPTGCSQMSIVDYSYSGDACFCPDGYTLGTDSYGNKTCSKTVDLFAMVDGATKLCPTGPNEKVLLRSSGIITLNSTYYPTCFNSAGTPSTSGAISLYNQNCSGLPSGQYREIITTEKTTQYGESYNCNVPAADAYNEAYMSDLVSYTNASNQITVCDLQACINACGPDMACVTACYAASSAALAALNNSRAGIYNRTCCNGVCTENKIGGGNGPPIYQDYTCNYTTKSREATKITKTKIPYFDQSLYTSSVKRWTETFKIVYSDLLASPHPCADSGCCSKVDIDFTIQAQIFKNMVAISLAGQTICFPKDRPIFQCPRVSFTSLNDQVYLCDTVSVLTSDCEIGNVL